MTSADPTFEQLIEELATFIDEIFIQQGKDQGINPEVGPLPLKSSAIPGSKNIPAETADEENAFIDNEACSPAEEFLSTPFMRASFGSLESELDNLDESFSECVMRLIDEREMSDVELYKKANISRQLFAKLRKDDSYRPSKKTAVAIAIALELDLEEAISLLEHAGYTLSRSSKFDVIIEFFLRRHDYDIFRINEALYEFGEPAL